MRPRGPSETPETDGLNTGIQQGLRRGASGFPGGCYVIDQQNSLGEEGAGHRIVAFSIGGAGCFPQQGVNRGCGCHRMSQFLREFECGAKVSFFLKEGTAGYGYPGLPVGAWLSARIPDQTGQFTGPGTVGAGCLPSKNAD